MSAGILHFEEKVNVRDEISKGILSEEWHRITGDTLLTDSIQLIGRENNSTLLFRYNTQPTQAGATLKRKTHIGVCNLRENKIRTLYTQDLDSNDEIIQCSVNEQLTLLVFCVASDGPVKTRGATAKDTWLYIAEVQRGGRQDPDRNKPIAIAPERKENAKTAQFVYGGSDLRRHQLIIFIQNEFVGVLNLQVDGSGKLRDRVEKYKPKWIIGKHHWYQWDVDKQHLFVITNNGELIDKKNPLEVWLPTEKENLEKLFSIPITMDSPSKRPKLSRFTLDQRVPDRNIVALTGAEGSSDATFCVCNQVPYERRDQREADEPFKLKYEIISFAHGKTMTVTVHNVPGRLRKHCINFSLFGTYVVAYLPDVFTHVININDTMDLGKLNIFSPGEHHARVEQWKGALSRVHLPHIRHRKGGVLMYDSDSMCIYHVSLNENTLLDTFSTSWNKEPSLPFEILSPDKLSNQLAVLQHQLQTTTDPTKSKNLLMTLKNNVTSTATVPVLTEYILGSAFAVASRKIDNDNKPGSTPINKLFCRHLQFSKTHEDSGEARNRLSVGVGEKKKAVQMDVSEIPSNRVIFADDKREIKRDCGFYHFLFLMNSKFYMNAEKHKRPTRLTTERAGKMLEQNVALKDKKNQGSNILRRFMNTMSRRKESQASHSGMLPSLEGGSSLDSSNSDSFPDSLLNEEADREKVEGLAGVYYDYLKQCYPADKRSPTKGQKPHLSLSIGEQGIRKMLSSFEQMSFEYVRVLMNQVNILLHHLYNIFELKELHNKMHHAVGKGDLLKAFHMFERYQYVVTDLGLPLPAEFGTMFATVGYSSLNPDEFMQYVGSGVIDITDEFLDILATDKDEKKASVKCECLAQMPYDQALKWSRKLMDSPVVGATATRLVAEDIFLNPKGGKSKDTGNSGGAAAKSHRKQSSSSGSTGEDLDDRDLDLPDPYRFMLNNLTKNGWKPGTDGVTGSMLEQAVLYYTKDVHWNK